MLRRIGAFVVAVTVMVVLGSAAHSVLVQRAWSIAAGEAAGAPPAAIPFEDRMTWIFHDLGGLALPLGALASVALLIAFLTAGIVVRCSRHRPLVFAVAAGFAIWVMFTAMRLVLGTVGIFGARGALGLTLQVADGTLAGWVFAILSTRGRR